MSFLNGALFFGVLFKYVKICEGFESMSRGRFYTWIPCLPQRNPKLTGAQVTVAKRDHTIDNQRQSFVWFLIISNLHGVKSINYIVSMTPTTIFFLSESFRKINVLSKGEKSVQRFRMIASTIIQCKFCC